MRIVQKIINLNGRSKIRLKQLTYLNLFKNVRKSSVRQGPVSGY